MGQQAGKATHIRVAQRDHRGCNRADHGDSKLDEIRDEHAAQPAERRVGDGNQRRNENRLKR